MKWFMGQYTHNLDQKNRLAIPAKIRVDLGESFILTVSPNSDPCLLAYTFEGWERVMASINNQPPSRELTYTQRFIYMNADKIELDNAGRMTIPAQFMEKVGFTKEVCILGAGERVEFWDSAKYAEMERGVTEFMQNKQTYFSI